MKRKSAAIWAFMLALIMVFSSAPVIYAEGEDTEAPSGSEAFCGEEDAGGELAAENEETDLSSGDVLTGIIAALAAQGSEPLDAARLGVYLHGLAGDEAAKKKGRYGMTASDIAEALPAVMSAL